MKYCTFNNIAITTGPVENKTGPVNFDKKIKIDMINIMTTNKCNMSCTYCFQTCKSKDTLSFKDYDRILDIIFNDEEDKDKFPIYELVEHDYSKTFRLHFIGGEPLICAEQIYYFIKGFESKLKNHNMNINFDIRTLTNGTLCKSEYFKKIVEEYGDKLIIFISMDGYNKESQDINRVFPNGSGTYDTIKESIKYLKGFKNVYHNVRYIISKENIEDISNTSIKLFEDGYNSVINGIVEDYIWSEEDSKKVFKQFKKISDYLLEYNRYETKKFLPFDMSVYNPNSVKDIYNNIPRRCEVFGNNILFIAPDKNVIPCIGLDKSSFGSNEQILSFGNIYDGIYNTKERLSFRNYLDNEFNNIDYYSFKCIHCPVVSNCGGCTFSKYREGKGNIMNENGCNVRIVFYLSALLYTCKLYNINKEFVNNLHINILFSLPIEICLKYLTIEEYLLINNTYRKMVVDNEIKKHTI